MFTLSDKQRVLNTPGHVRVYSSANVERLTAAAVASGDTLLIEGFGSFPLASITDIKLRRAVAPVKDSKDFTAVVPAGLAIGDAIKVRVKMSTMRQQAELAVNARLGGVHYFEFMSPKLAAVAATDVRDAIVAGYASFLATYTNAIVPFTVANGATTSKANFAAATGYESVTIEGVEISRAAQGIGLSQYTSLVPTVIATGTEGKGQGKFLEESIRMGGATGNPYGVDTIDTRVDIRGSYSALYFSLSVTRNEDLSTLAAGHGPLLTNHKYAVFLNESTCFGTDAAIDKLVAATLVVEAASATLTSNGYTASAITRAQEETEVLFDKSENSISGSTITAPALTALATAINSFKA